MVLTTAAIIALAAIFAGAMSSKYAMEESAKDSYNDTKNYYIDEISKSHPELSHDEVSALVDNYMRNEGNTNWGNYKTYLSAGLGLPGLLSNLDNSPQDFYIDKDGLYRVLSDVSNNRYNIPDPYSGADLQRISDEASTEIDAEIAKMNALYDQVLNRSVDAYNKELDSSNQAYNDYVNQVLTENAMSQQSIAGSTRYELDRQQRNAITRGASAAQRLVANINTQLGLQNKAAQQSLETSNVLAQNLLNQRQAGINLRQNYMNTLNTDAMNRANLINGSTERKANYGQSQAQYKDYLHERDIQNIEDKIDRDYQGNSVAAGIVRRRSSNNTNTKQYGNYL